MSIHKPDHKSDHKPAPPIFAPPAEPNEDPKRDADTTPDNAGDRDDQGDEHKGRLLLATGELVNVPAEGVAVSTSHHSPKVGGPVPVTGCFVIA